MTAPDYPPGKWSPLLVGAQWVSGTTLTVITNALANRRATVTNFSDLHETLQSALNTSLAGQEGATADAIRDGFRQGADQAFQIAEKNEVYAKALQHAHNSVIALRQLLTDIAAKGNKEIDDAQSSKADLATKAAKICEVIADCQREANQKAAGCADDIMDAGQNVFTAQGIGQSFRGLAHGNGIDNVNQQPDLNAIEDQVRGKLDQATGPAPPGAPSESGPLADGGALAPTAAPAGYRAPMANHGSQAETPQLPAPAPAPSAPMANHGPQAETPQLPAPAPAPSAPMANHGPQAGTPVPAPGMPGGGSPSLSAGLPGSAQLPSSPMSGMSGGWAPANPADMAAGLNSGISAGAPVAAAAAAPPAGPVQAVDPQDLQAAMPTLPSSGAGAAATDMPPPMQPAAAPHAPPPAAYTPEPVSPMMTGAGAGPASSGGGLPAYGADLRPPVAASAPSAPVSPPPPPSTVSGSAPVSPAGGQVGIGQPPVASQPGPATPAGAQPGMGPQVVMATASGAAAGAMSADATARARLQRLVAAVARQQPLLAWGVGDRQDGTTVLVTDLASGWIPPDLDIPSAVTLLEPARRRGGLEALLGAVDPAATYSPGHYVPDPDADEPVATSPWPRHAPDVEEMTWQLTDATLWRDGLPRLAHTLAKAASKGTGVLESEAEQLHAELTTLAERVLEGYPDEVDAAEVGNWQLLAAIDALVTDDWTAANYHLAWFLACNTAVAESAESVAQ